MHYKNQRPAKVGDFIIATDFAGTPFAGIVAILNPSGGGCGLQMLPFGAAGGFLYFDPAVCVRVDDLDAKPYDPADDPDGPLSLELKEGRNAAALVALHVVAMGAAGATIPVKLADGSLFTVVVSPGAPALDLGQPQISTPPAPDAAWMDQPRFGGEGHVDTAAGDGSGGIQVAPGTDGNGSPTPPVSTVDPVGSPIAVPENPEKVN